MQKNQRIIGGNMNMNPTFEEFLGGKKVFHPELKGQYEMLWKLYCT